MPRPLSRRRFVALGATTALGALILPTTALADENGSADKATPLTASGYTAIPLDGKKSGTLDAGAAGRFRYYKFWAGAGSTIGVDMQVSPDDGGVLSTAGYKLYGPQNGREYLQSQAQKGKTPNVTG